MLIEVFSALAAERWIDAAHEYEKTVYLSHGAAHSMLLSRRGRPEYFVKFSDRSSLKLEAERCALAAERFPGIAPGFIGHTRRPSIEILVTRAVSVCSIDPSTIRSRCHMATMHADLEDFFSRTRANARPPSTRWAWTEEYGAYFRAHPLHARAESSLDRMLAALKGLPVFDQHGDFVVNNLGLGRDNRLAVFDWEDYGAVDVPGLDLFTLEFSLRGVLGWSALPGAEALKARGRAVLDLERMCGALQVPLSVFENLRLSYAFVFRFLKRNYSHDIRDRVDTLLAELIADSAATD